MAAGQLFDGEAVMEFSKDRDRRTFLKWAGIVGVGCTLTVLLKSGYVAAQTDDRDIDILNYALTLEYLEADFYEKGLDTDLLSGRELALVEPIGAHEKEHVSLITSTIEELGGTPVELPGFNYPGGTFGSKDKFLQTAYTFEALGVTAYHGQVANFQSGDLLAAAATIAGTESRHAAILADLTGQDPFPRPLERPASRNQVLEVAGKFISG